MEAYDPNNVFAKILRGEIPSYKIFETEHALAVLDAFPMAEGHSLLIPKAPCVSVLDMSADVASSVLAELPRLARMVQLATGAPGVNVLQNSGKAAGQAVFHCHFHVFPRFEGDGLPTGHAAGKGPPKQLGASDAARLLEAMRLPFVTSIDMADALISQMAAGRILPPVRSAAAAPSGAATTQAKQPARSAAPAPSPATAAPQAAPSPAASTPKQKGPDAKPDAAAAAASKADKKAAKQAAQAAAAAKKGPAGGDEDRPVDVSWADIRVGVILDASAHPESPKLYVETIDLGEPAPRTVLSGLAAHMPLEKVKGARVVVICNLKPRKMAGIESQGMVLCASDAEKTALDFVLPPDGAAAGTRVEWPGYPGEPETAKKMDKKKVWEAIQPELSTDASGRACYRGVPFTVADDACTSSVKGGIIS